MLRECALVANTYQPFCFREATFWFGGGNDELGECCRKQLPVPLKFGEERREPAIFIFSLGHMGREGFFPTIKRGYRSM